MRVGLSPAASRWMSEIRLRRLLEIELQGTALIADDTPGPLTDPLGWSWIDMPSRATVLIESRVNSHPPRRRSISVEGLGSDVAARMVAIAVAEQVRALSQPARVRKVQPSRSPCCDQAEALARSTPAWAGAGSFGAAVLPGPGWTLVGPSASLGLRIRATDLRVAAGWKGGLPDSASVSWSEIGLAFDHRFVLRTDWRWSLGAAAHAALLRFGGERAVNGDPSDRETGSARVAVRAGLETRISDGVWLSLAMEPGLILRQVSWQTSTGQQSVGGAWLGLDLGLAWERRPWSP